MDSLHRHQAFSPDILAGRLAALPGITRFWVAYSGGRDSHVLIHAVSRLQQSGRLQTVLAVHVDHGLQASSADWARHCAVVCAGLQIPLTQLRVDARAAKGESPEAAARHARYHAIAQLMREGDCLLTAHHQDDQAETLLLQLLRGGGPHGLAAMPASTSFAAGMHARPLLDFSRAELGEYAQRHGLQWIDDLSNSDTGFDRNYLREIVMPLVRDRWPSMARVLARGASHQAEAAELMDVLAAHDLDQCRNEDDTLRISTMLTLDEARQRNLLRYWLKGMGFKLPDSIRLAHLQRELLHAAPDREPALDWEGVSVRRFRDSLYALTPRVVIDGSMVLPWDIAAPLQLSDGAVLRAMSTLGQGVKAALCNSGTVTVRYRQGGEQCQPAPRAARRPLKKLLQEAGVPPWERERIPLIYVGEQLAAVVGYWICETCRADETEEGISFELNRTTRVRQ